MTEINAAGTEYSSFNHYVCPKGNNSASEMKTLSNPLIYKEVTEGYMVGAT